MGNSDVRVLFRSSKRTGAVDTTMTGIGSALMQMWALRNTPKTKCCMIFERESGKLTFISYGTDGGFPKVRKGEQCEGKMCTDFGIPLEVLHNIKDDRFDAEVV